MTEPQTKLPEKTKKQVTFSSKPVDADALPAAQTPEQTEKQEQKQEQEQEQEQEHIKINTLIYKNTINNFSVILKRDENNYNIELKEIKEQKSELQKKEEEAEEEKSKIKNKDGIKELEEKISKIKSESEKLENKKDNINYDLKHNIKVSSRKGNKMINANRFVKLNIMVANNLFHSDTFRKFSLKNVIPAKSHIVTLIIPLYYNLPKNTPVELFGSIIRMKDYINLVKAKKGETFKSEKTIDISNFSKEQQIINKDTSINFNKNTFMNLIREKREREFIVLENNIRLLLSLLFVKGNNYYIPGFDNLYIYKYDWLKEITQDMTFNLDKFVETTLKENKTTINIYVKLILSLEEINFKQQTKLNCDVAKVELKDDLKRMLISFNILPKKLDDDDKYKVSDFDNEEDINLYHKFITTYPGIYYLNNAIFNYSKAELLNINDIEDDLKLLYDTMKLPGYRSYNSIGMHHRSNFDEIIDNYKNSSSFLKKYNLKNVSKQTIFSDLLRDYKMNMLRISNNYGKSRMDTGFQIKFREEKEKIEKDKGILKSQREQGEKMKRDKEEEQIKKEYEIPQELPFDTEFEYINPNKPNLKILTTFRKKMKQIKREDVKIDLIKQAKINFNIIDEKEQKEEQVVEETGLVTPPQDPQDLSKYQLKEGEKIPNIPRHIVSGVVDDDEGFETKGTSQPIEIDTDIFGEGEEIKAPPQSKSRRRRRITKPSQEEISKFSAVEDDDFQPPAQKEFKKRVKPPEDADPRFKDIHEHLSKIETHIENFEKFPHKEKKFIDMELSNLKQIINAVKPEQQLNNRDEIINYLTHSGYSTINDIIPILNEEKTRLIQEKIEIAKQLLKQEPEMQFPVKTEEEKREEDEEMKRIIQGRGGNKRKSKKRKSNKKRQTKKKRKH
jgi:hypothetical protein